MENGTTVPLIEDDDNNNLGCPHYSFDSWQYRLFTHVNFWAEGVVVAVVATLGVVGNAVATVVLTRKRMRNPFNLLLVAMAGFDTIFLFGMILESFRKHFDLASRAHIALFPHLLWPLTSVGHVGSVFMIVAIAHERFTAVCHPEKYARAMLQENAVRKRTTRTVSRVALLALIFSLPKFLEVEVWGDAVYATGIRKHPSYSVFAMWTVSIFTGIIPFALLILLYARVCLTVRERRRSQQDYGEAADTEGNVMLECYAGEGVTEVYEMTTTELSTIDNLTGRATRRARSIQLG